MATKQSQLRKKLVRLRERRGLTHYSAAKEMGVGRESLKRLEEGTTDPEKTPLATILAVTGYYWPDLNLNDWTTQKGGRQLVLTVKEKK